MIYDVRLEQLDLFYVLDIKGTRLDVASRLAELPITLPEKPNTASKSNEVLLCWVGPTQWILLAPGPSERRLVQALQPDAPDTKTSLVDISDTMQFFAVRGPAASNVLAICSPLDTHPTLFGDDTVTFTELLGTKALLLRAKDGFQFAVDRSYASFIDDNLHRIIGAPLPVEHAGAAADPFEVV